MGLAGYYRKFVKNFSMIATPLTDLTKDISPEKVVWNEELELAFSTIKKMLVSNPILRSLNPDLKYCLQTDASGLGIGAVLTQRSGIDQEEYATAYFSKKLLPAERNYASAELECLAIVKACAHFDIYLSGASFTIETDNKALVQLKQFRETKGRLARWALALQCYDFTISHRKGTDNDNADGLSRQFPVETSTFLEEGEGVRGWTTPTSLPIEHSESGDQKIT